MFSPRHSFQESLAKDRATVIYALSVEPGFQEGINSQDIGRQVDYDSKIVSKKRDTKASVH